MMNTTTGDSGDFLGFLDNQNIIEFTAMRFSTWTSRSIIELFTVTLVHVPLLWAMLDIMVAVFIYTSLSSLFNASHKSYISWVIVILILCYSYVDMDTAGWIPTTIPYTWTLSCGLYVFVSYRDALLGHKTSLWKSSLCIIATLFASNEEQLGAIMAVGGLIVFLETVRRHRASALVACETGIAMLECVVALTCPGNAARTAANTAYWLPEFSSFSTLHKLYLGFASTMNRYVYEGNILFLILCVMVVILVFRKTQSPVARLISLVPLGAEVISSWMTSAATVSWPYLAVSTFMCQNLQIGERSMGSLGLQVLVVVALAVSVLIIYGWTWDSFINLVILGGGLGSRVCLGFSPSLFASSSRTFIFMDFAIIMAILYAVGRSSDELTRNQKSTVLVALGALASCSVVNVLAYLVQ
ncbi:MAG: hypothetical protein LKF55_00100 [Atopobiaceae bacterium]|nr:hypothetical protein [Atopobiaceae bacterium]MCH4213440.1 hypothetical protein [Atopobiaceae bacterium]